MTSLFGSCLHLSSSFNFRWVFFVCNHVTRRPCWWSIQKKFFCKICIKIEFISQRRETLLFLTTNMAAVTSLANQQLALYVFFRAIYHCRSPHTGIMKLEWWVEASFWKKPEVRDNFTMIWAPKVIETKHGARWVKLSLWPFCGWIPGPTKASWASFHLYRMQSVHIFASRTGSAWRL